jgi:hypothetical protein
MMRKSQPKTLNAIAKDLYRQLAVIDVNTVDATGTPSRWVTLPYSSLESFTEKPGMEKFAEAIRQCQQLFPSAWIVLLLYPPDRNDIRPRYGPKSHAKQ